MRATCLAAVVGVSLSLIPLRLPAQPSPEEDFPRWRAELQRQEERLRRQEWAEAAKKSRDLVEEMVDGMLVGEGAAAMLGLAVLQQAVAEAALGRRDEAVWLLHLAQNLDARYRDVELGSYGPAGEELERFRLRQAGEAPARWPQLPVEGSFRPPSLLRRKKPATPAALARALVADETEVEMAITSDGRVVEPVLLTEPVFPSLAFVILDSLREWRFHPAQRSRTPVRALFRARIAHDELLKTVEASRLDQRAAEFRRLAGLRLESLDARLRRGEGQAVHAALRELVADLRAAGPEHDLLAKALWALALAEAGTGREDKALWHWQVAQNLSPFSTLDAAAYGEAGAFLARHTLRRRDEAPAGMEVVAVADLGAGSTPPRKVAGEEPEIPDVLASPRAPQWARLQVVVDTQGRVVEPVILAGRSPGFQWAALEAVRTWRFEPARRDEQPVAVFLEIEVPPRAETPLAEMLPFTGEAGSVHDLVLQQEWGTARTKAAALVQRVAEEPETDPRQSAAALALLALADAGSGGPSSACYWHAAQSLYGDLYHATLAAYGAAGARLEESNPWRVKEEIFPISSTPGGETIARPKKISGPGPEYTTWERKAGVQGVVVMEIVVDESGRVSQPRVLRGLSRGLVLRTLTALCDWRFKPATLGGKPVTVYYHLTMSFQVF